MKKIISETFWLLEVGFRTLKIRLISSFLKNYSDTYRLMIKVNESCNYKCVTCGNWKKHTNTFLSEKTQKKIISQYKGRLLFLSITGGEPFLYEKKLFKFITNIKKLNPNLKRISINTNCSKPEIISFFTEKILSKFPDLNLHLGLQYIPSKKWGYEKTGIKIAYLNYKKTEKIANALQRRFKNQFSFYKIITISKKRDAKSIRREKNLWLNFATINSFYNNTDNSYVEEINSQEKIRIIDKFLHLNKKNVDFLNKQYLLGLRRMFKGGRSRRCYAGINRLYINNRGKIFICSREVKVRKNISPSCRDCWTACEANFDLLSDFFIPFLYG